MKNIKNKKGFTLIELIAVIVILGLIALITVPIVNNSLKDAKEKMLVEQTDRIINAAKNYMVESDLLTNYDEELGFQRLVSIIELRKNSYLEDKDIVNPVTEEIMNGCVLAKYEESKYNYSYLENCVPLEYENVDRFIYGYTKGSFDSETLNEFLTGLSGSIGIDHDIYIPEETIMLQRTDAEGFLFSKDDEVLTEYNGWLIKTDTIESTMYLYQVLFAYAQIISTNAEEISMYVDNQENIIYFGFDLLKSAEQMGDEYVEQIKTNFSFFNNQNIQTLADLCLVETNVTGSTCPYTAFGNLKLDN